MNLVDQSNEKDKWEFVVQGMRLGSVSHRATFGKQMGCADPPRVWLRGQDHPGCSYTRSLGDALAKKAGVTCDPEILTHMLSPKDAMVVLCTDGVTEFLSNESIIQICSRFKDPAHACEEVVKIACVSSAICLSVCVSAPPLLGVGKQLCMHVM